MYNGRRFFFFLITIFFHFHTKALSELKNGLKTGDENKIYKKFPMIHKNFDNHFCQSNNKCWNNNVLCRKYFYFCNLKKRNDQRKQQNLLFIQDFKCKHCKKVYNRSSLVNESHRISKNRILSQWQNPNTQESLYYRKEKDEINGENVESVVESKQQLKKKYFHGDREDKLRQLLDHLNDFIDLETYREKYGDEIYNEIIQLYVKREIPLNYEKIYFSESIEKSVAFKINKYDDVEFQKRMEQEFRENGVLIDVIDKIYYNKTNVKRIQNVLHYLPLMKLINNPTDLKKLKKKYIPLLIHELKVFVHLLVNYRGGHFSSVLCLAELQVMLHYIFNQPHDEIMYDVGHQVLINKMITGRKYISLSLRTTGGMSGYFMPSESMYDTFITGHSSTGLSVMQGFYEADRHLREVNPPDEKYKNKEHRRDEVETSDESKSDKSTALDKFYMVVIGDGAMTGGIALEALNYISFLNSKILIIYNDNNEISLPTNVFTVSGNKPVGSIATHLIEFINKNKRAEMQGGASSVTSESKGSVEKNFFEILNYEYIGPVDGNNVHELYDVLTKIKKNKIRKSSVLHIRTNKSNKFINDRDPIAKMHMIKPNEICPFDVKWLDGNEVKEKSISDKENDMKQTEQLSNSLFDDPFTKETATAVKTQEFMNLLEKDKNIVLINPATFSGAGLVDITKKFQKNLYDVAIAEQHSVTFATAMAKRKKLKVFLIIYSTFLQRAYDQIVHDLNLQKIPLKVFIARSGLIGGDGATHHGLYDLTFLSALENVNIISPSNQVDLKKAIHFAYHDTERILFIRVPKAYTFKDSYLKEYMNMKSSEIEEVDLNNFFGKARIIQMAGQRTSPNGKSPEYTLTNKKKKIAILNMGYMINNVIAAVKELENDKNISDKFSFSIIDMIFLNPFDKNIVDFIIKENKHEVLITYEDNTFGGFSAHFNSYLLENNYILKYNLLLYNIYFPTVPVGHGTIPDQWKTVKMDKLSLIKRIKNLLKKNYS